MFCVSSLRPRVFLHVLLFSSCLTTIWTCSVCSLSLFFVVSIKPIKSLMASIAPCGATLQPCRATVCACVVPSLRGSVPRLRSGKLQKFLNHLIGSLRSNLLPFFLLTSSTRFPQTCMTFFLWAFHLLTWLVSRYTAHWTKAYTYNERLFCFGCFSLKCTILFPFLRLCSSRLLCTLKPSEL